MPRNGAKLTAVLKIPLPEGYTDQQVMDLMNRLGQITDSYGGSALSSLPVSAALRQQVEPPDDRG